MQIAQTAIGWIVAGCLIIPSIELFVSALMPSNKKNTGTHEQHSQ